MNPLGDNAVRPLRDASAFGTGSAGSLTYEPFYGLREKPFSLSADPRFLYKSQVHAPAFDAILAGIRRREGLIVLTGEIGTGKTTLCRSVLKQLDRRTFGAFVPDPFVSREDLLKTLLMDFGVIAVSDLTRGRFNGASRSELSYLLYEFLDSLVPLKAFAVLVIDEAQNLSLPLLEEIRILSELERREKLLQVVLVGQPELRESLTHPQMRQLDQRVSVRCELMPLDAGAVTEYVNHRLVVAGLGSGSVEFTSLALEALHHGSAGVPRVINRLCDRALERAYAARTTRIDSEIVWESIHDLGLRPTRLARSTADKPASLIVQAPASMPTFGSDPIAYPPKRETSPPAHPFGRRQWIGVAVAASLGVVLSAGVPAWYLRAHTDDNVLLAAPPLSPPLFSAPGVMPHYAQPTDQPASEPDAAAQASAEPAAEDGNFTIVVASLTDPERAQRLVDELTTAGYRARAVEHDWGPLIGRWLQVNVGGYASVIQVQHDLQQIRELPGGYRDARIVQRE